VTAAAAPSTAAQAQVRGRRRLHAASARRSRSDQQSEAQFARHQNNRGHAAGFGFLGVAAFAFNAEISSRTIGSI